MQVSWKRQRFIPSGTGTVVRTLARDDIMLAEVSVSIPGSDPEWTTFNIPTLIIPVELCTPVKVKKK